MSEDIEGNAFERPDWGGWHGPSDDPNDRQFGDAIEPLTLAAADDADVVFVGEPYDGAVMGRRGTRHAPVEIRRSLAGLKTYHFNSTGRESGDRMYGDLGDVSIPDDDVAGVQTALRRQTARIHETGALPVFLGGDNSLTYPNVAPLLEEADVGVVNVDAHLDCREVRDGPTSGTPYRQLLEAGLSQYVCVGARHFGTSGAYAGYIEDTDGTVVTADAFEQPTTAIVSEVRDAIGDVDRLYLSVDCDVLDATAAPGVSAPTPGGLTTRELFAFVEAVAGDDRLAGIEVVECSPPLDEQNRTVDAAAGTVAHAVSGYLEGTL